MTDTPIILPPEWATHSAVWSAWPSHSAMWKDDLEGARHEVAAFFRAIMADGEGEPVKVLVANEVARKSAEEMLADTKAEVYDMDFGDIWIRDTGPLFTIEDGKLAAKSFGFNGWGGKYEFDGDGDVGRTIALKAQAKLHRLDPILEGGAIDFDGEGRVLTTRQCVLNKNRGADVGEGMFETFAADALGLSDVIWLEDGLEGDRTDGHVDNLARFVAPGKVVTMTASGYDDPNAATYENTAHTLTQAGLDVVRVPSPGRFVGKDGNVMPASFMNFFIGNKTVVVPVYGTQWDDEAVDAIGALFPDRQTVGLPANHLLTGGGSFHCITQQQPSLEGS